MVYDNIVGPDFPSNVVQAPFGMLEFYTQPWVFYTLIVIGLWLAWVWLHFRQLQYGRRYIP